MSTEQRIEAAVLCVLCERFRDIIAVTELHAAASESARMAIASIED